MSSIQQPPRSPVSGPYPVSTDPVRKGAAPFPRPVLVGILLALLALLAALWLANSGAIEGTLRSPQALALTVGAIVAIILLNLILRRAGLAPAPRLLVLTVPAVALFWLYLLPSFQEGTVVDEALPGAAVASPAEGPGTEVTGAAAPAAPTAQADPQQPTGTQSTDQPAEVDPAEVDPAEVDPADEVQPPDATAPAGPVQLSTGTFVGLDGHAAEGTAAIYRLEDGSHIVRLEEVDIQNTPAPVVYLVPGADATGPGPDFIDLGPLTGNIGSSNYAIPPDVDPEAGWTVLVWCSTFASPIGGATQV